MSRCTLVAALSGALLAGCSAPAACEVDYNDFAPSVSAKPLPTTTTLKLDGEALTLHFHASVGNLPELWQDHSNITDGSITLGLAVAYQAPPLGSDGKTQMPRVSSHLSLGDLDDSIEVATSEFQSGSASAEMEAFKVCQSDGQRGCCKYGERTCSLPLVLSVRRLDGEPFPPVDATVTLGASAAVTRCPIDDHQQATLELTADSP